MKNEDEDLQNRFDLGERTGDGVDAQAYQKVFDALKREPDYELPIYFADRLMTMIESKNKTRETSRDNLWLALGLVSFLLAVIVSIVLTDFQVSFGAFQFFAGNAGLLAFALAFVMLLNWVDRKIIRKTEAF